MSAWLGRAVRSRPRSWNSSETEPERTSAETTGASRPVGSQSGARFPNGGLRLFFRALALPVLQLLEVHLFALDGRADTDVTEVLAPLLPAVARSFLFHVEQLTARGVQVVLVQLRPVLVLARVVEPSLGQTP